MRKTLVMLMVMLLVGAVAFAQTQDSTPGATYNDAYLEIEIGATLPGFPNQASFTVPDVQFIIEADKVIPGATVNLRIKVRNNTDRQITVTSDPSEWPDTGDGFSVSSSPLVLDANAAGWFVYTVTMPDREALDALIEDNPPGHTFVFPVTLVAVAEEPEDSTDTFDQDYELP